MGHSSGTGFEELGHEFSKESLKLEFEREQARRSMGEFSLFTDKGYEMNWHHRLLCEYLDGFVKKECLRLMVFMPPRHGKSELVSRKLPAYILGREPEAQVLSASYSSDLASKMGRDVQRIMDSEEYLELFPQSYLKKVGSRRGGDLARRTALQFDLVGRGGSYLGAGVGAGITGRGADYVIIDDPVKNRMEAASPTYRKRIWEWYTSTLRTRLEKNGSVLLTLTRWHEDDLAGKLLELGRGNGGADQWEVLTLPAIAEEESAHMRDIRSVNQALWENKYSFEELMRTKMTVGSMDWSALYQQRPQPEGGTLFRRGWLSHYYEGVPSGATVIQSWDLPFVSSDSSAKCAALVLARKGSQIFVMDCINEKMSFVDTVGAIRSLSGKYPQARGKVIEDKANGPALLSFLQKELSGMVPFCPKGSKQERARSVTPYFEAGNVLFPDPKKSPWVNDLVMDLLTFPTGKYMDTVDALVQGILYLMEKPSYDLGGDQLGKVSYFS